MTSASSSSGVDAPPVLVLGLGNVLLGDDGLGPTLLNGLAERYASELPNVEFLDGGTQGLALLGCIARRGGLIILDALATGQKPGTVSVFEGSEVLAIKPGHAMTAHEGNAGELLASAAMLGDLPERVYLIGVEPASLKTGMGLSEEVYRSLGLALEESKNILLELLADLAAPTNR